MPSCPNHPSVAIEPKKKGWYCEECEANVLTYEQLPREEARTPESAARSWPGGLDPATMPTWLAHPWASLCDEHHPRVKLHWLVDTAELVVRWTVAIALAEVRHANEGVLPHAVTGAIAEHIERPTLGRWLGVLRALTAAAPVKPVVTDGLFRWAVDTLPASFRSEQQGGTADDSILVLRNQVAHGGCVGRERAQTLVDTHLPGLVRLLRGSKEVLGATLVMGGGRVLIGTAPVGSVVAPREGVWLVRGEVALALEPLVRHGPVAHVGPDGELHERPVDAAPQLYSRAAPERLTYTPFGVSEAHADRLDVAAFRALFGLDGHGTAPGRAVEGGFAWDDFLREARVLSEDLVGRQSELATVKAWLKSVDTFAPDATRLGWISSGPGVGKSMLMARLATMHENPRHRGLFLHRFRGGDARNSRRSFLRLLREALCAWSPLAAVSDATATYEFDGYRLEEDVKTRLAAIATLEVDSSRGHRPEFWGFVDGLDEAVAGDPGLGRLIKELAVPGTVWLVAGRPEHGLETTLTGPGCAAVFPAGLPPMSADDIRAMLVEGLGPLRYALFARDADDGAHVQNAFVDAVVRRAQGLPLYVHLLLEDLRAGHLRVTDESRLPDGLTAYYDDLVARLGVSDVRADLTAIVALLSQAAEPLDTEGLSLLLAGSPGKIDRFRPRVDAALRVGAALLRRAPSPDTPDAWALYHQSFREYVCRAPSLAGSVADQRERLAKSADAWSAHSPQSMTPIRNHLFRWGNDYGLWWAGTTGVEAVRGRLTDFAYLHARTAALPANEVADLTEEYAAVLKASGADRDLSVWAAFVRERAHLLRRGGDSWPVNRILLQLAVEHADNSPVTKAAEAWLESGACDWIWLRRTERHIEAAPSSCLLVLEGHSEAIRWADQWADGKIVSKASGADFKLWSSENGSVLRNLPAAHRISDGRLMSIDRRHLRIWDESTGEILQELEELTEQRLMREWKRIRDARGFSSSPDDLTRDAIQLPNGRLLSWSWTKTLHLRDGRNGELVATLSGHSGAVLDAMPLGEDRILSWSTDGTLRIWDGGDGRALATLAGHSGWVMGVRILPDGRLLSWSEDGSLCLWDGRDGRPLGTLSGHTDEVNGAMVLMHDRVLSWSVDGTLRVWNTQTGENVSCLSGDKSEVSQVITLPDGVMVSLSRNGVVRCWNIDQGTILSEVTVADASRPERRHVSRRKVVDESIRMRASDREVLLRFLDTKPDDFYYVSSNGLCAEEARKYVKLLGDARLLTSSGAALTIWDSRSGVPLVKLEGHTDDVLGARALSDGRILSWSKDKTLRLWDPRIEGPRSAMAGLDSIEASPEMLSDGRMLIRCSDDSLRVIDPRNEERQVTLSGDAGASSSVRVIPDGRLMTSSADRPVCLWDMPSGKKSLTFKSTEKFRNVVVLSDGRIVAWTCSDELSLWNGATGEFIERLGKDGRRALMGLKGLGENQVLTWYEDGVVILWRISNDTIVRKLNRLIRRFVMGEDALDYSHSVLVIQNHGQLDDAWLAPDGRLLTWFPLRFWNATSGELLETVRERDEAISVLERLGQRTLVSEKPSTPRSYEFVERGTRGMCIQINSSSSRCRVRWHADGDWIPDLALPSGTVLAHGHGQLANLHLCHGNQRVTLEEAAQIVESQPQNQTPSDNPEV